MNRRGVSATLRFSQRASLEDLVSGGDMIRIAKTPIGRGLAKRFKLACLRLACLWWDPNGIRTRV
jgi:hypothetical protein